MTEIGRLQAELTQLSLRDPLTGLANRTLLDQQLNTALWRATRTGDRIVVAFLDLNNFKGVNDIYGHAAGDAVLRAVAERLTRIVRRGDVLARIGGDDFVVVLDPAGDIAAELLTRIGRALAVPVDIGDGQQVTCTASIGVAENTRVGNDAKRLLAAADADMYVSKRVARVALRPEAD